MPRGDRTGPWGAGPRTGRGLGFCSGYDAPGYADLAPWGGRGHGYARGGGYGWRHWYYATGMPGWMRAGYAPLPTEDEIGDLKAQSEFLKKQLDAIHKRIEELEKD
jgi:hypothetical protein